MEKKKISSKSWNNSIKKNLKQLKLKGNQPPRVAVIGMGNELNGDDAAGVMVARELKAELNENSAWLVIDAGLAPENFTGTLRRFKPDLIILVDAAQMHLLPGAIQCVDWRETGNFSASTHSLPPLVLSQYLTEELGCEILLVGIQAADTEAGSPISLPVQKTITWVTKELSQLLLATK
jgi:hydrogenase 3 maturation protease